MCKTFHPNFLDPTRKQNTKLAFNKFVHSSSFNRSFHLIMCSSPASQRAPCDDRRRVRFDMDGDAIKTEFYASTFVRETEDDIHLWWQPTEFAAIKKSALNVTLLIKEGDTLFPRKKTTSYIHTLTKVYTVALSGKAMSAPLLNDLAFWTSKGHSRRGLEKFVVDEVRVDRMKRRQKLVAAVLFMQDKCYENKMTDDQCTRLMRLTSEKLSKPAACMAIIMGTADMLAIYSKPQDCRSSPPEKIKKKTSTMRDMIKDTTCKLHMMTPSESLPPRSPLLALKPRIFMTRSA